MTFFTYDLFVKFISHYYRKMGLFHNYYINNYTRLLILHFILLIYRANFLGYISVIIPLVNFSAYYC